MNLTAPIKLQALSRFSSNELRTVFDLLEVFKIFKGFENVDPLTFFELSTAPTRGHSSKIVKPRGRLDVRKFSFTHRLVDMWNSVDERIVACDSINGFKNRLDKFLYGRGFSALSVQFFTHSSLRFLLSVLMMSLHPSGDYVIL